MGMMMSQKEAKRAQIMEQLTAGNLDQKEAAKRMGVTVRQTRRILKRYRILGIAGLVSKKRGQASNRRLDEGTKRLSIELIGTHYRDFGPTLACEKLAERHGIRLCIESTRQIIGLKGSVFVGWANVLLPTDYSAWAERTGNGAAAGNPSASPLRG